MKRILSIGLLAIFCLSTSFAQVNISSELLKKHVYFLASDELEGRGLGTESGAKAAEYIVGNFTEIGLKPVGDSYYHPFHTRQGQTVIKGRNLVGMIEGSDPVLKNEYIVLGAHYDHVSYKMVDGVKVVYNGADDNASGSAGIIEIGRALVKHKDQLKRSVIIVAFDGEESGLIGSGFFVSQNIVPIDRVKLMMSIDMIGRYAESDYLIMGAMESLKNGAEILKPIAEKYDVKIKKMGTEISNRTDSKPFGDAGIPALHITSGIIGPYHKPEDDPETLDYLGMATLSNLLYDLAVTVANEEDLIPIAGLKKEATVKGTPFFRFGVLANLGGSHFQYPGDYYRGKGKFSAEGGLMAQLKITKNFSLQPEVLYSTSASGFPAGNIRMHSICTPLSLLITTNMNPMANQRFYAKIGGYYSYHFAGSANKTALDYTNQFEQTETGLIYGLGLEAMNVSLSVNFKHGLSNILTDPAIDEIKNRAWYITLGYIF